MTEGLLIALLLLALGVAFLLSGIEAGVFALSRGRPLATGAAFGPGLNALTRPPSPANG